MAAQNNHVEALKLLCKHGAQADLNKADQARLFYLPLCLIYYEKEGKCYV